MRKFTTLIVCLVLASGTFAKGKGGDFNKFTLGAKGGLNVTKLGNDVGGSGKVGFHVGAVGEYRMSHLFAIAPEIMYSSQGARGMVGDYKAVINANYLNIPILARFYVINALSLEVGPQFGFNMGMKMTVKNGGASASQKIEKDTYNVFDLGLGFGLTYNFKNCFASIRYNYGFINVDKDISSKNTAFQLSVGYNFLRKN